jgi:signal transduction histidine kinase
MATVSGCVEAAVGADWLERLLEVPEPLHVVPVEQSQDGPPLVGLPEPFGDLAIQPTAESWQRILKEYRGRIAMMVSEGSFFAILLFVLIGLLIRTLRREAELERRHRNFLSAITHELKSPLASMQLALETVLAGRADETMSRRFLGNALADAGRLEELVQKVLQVARYDRGAGRLELEPGSISRVVRRVLEVFERRAGSAGGTVDADIRDDVWARINDEALGIAVSNLLENALKYGGSRPEVGVQLSIREGRAVLDVSDSGAGIPADDLSQIFERFYRGGDEMTRTSNGTGLGLYLVRQIVTAHRGTVEVAETGPQGTTLRVTLPNAELRETLP